MLSWIMLGVSFTQLLKFSEYQSPGYAVYAVVMLVVALIGFGCSVQGSYLVRLQCAMLRTFCWPAVGLHAILSQNAKTYAIPFYAFLALAEALIYIKLYLLLSQRRDEQKSGE